METQREQLRKRLGRLQQEQKQLEAECKGLARDINNHLNYLLKEVGEMDVPAAATLMDALVVKQAHLLVLGNKTLDLEDALGY